MGYATRGGHDDPARSGPATRGEHERVDALADLSSRPGQNRGLVIYNGDLDGLLSITDLDGRLRPVLRLGRCVPDGPDDCFGTVTTTDALPRQAFL